MTSVEAREREFPQIRVAPPNATSTSSKSDHVLIADALRAAAILSVVAYHLFWTARPAIGSHTLSFGFFGVWGVDCFFVLTGFLLGRRFVSAIVDRATPFPALGPFLLRRFLRIYPMYVATIVAIAIVTFALSGHAPAGKDILSHVLFLQGFFPQYVYSIDSPLWTMGIDAGFYLALPIAAFAARAALGRASREGRIRGLCVGLVAVAVGGALYRFVQYSQHPSALFDYAASIVFVRNLWGMSGSFAVGLLIALAVVSSADLGRRWSAAFIVAGVALWALELALRLELNSAASIVALARATIVDPMAAVSSGLILYGLTFGRFERARSFAGSLAVQRVAALSYGVYLVHMPVITAIESTVLRGRSGFGALAQLTLIAIPVVVGLSYVANRYIEKPFLKMKLRFEVRS